MSAANPACGGERREVAAKAAFSAKDDVTARRHTIAANGAIRSRSPTASSTDLEDDRPPSAASIDHGNISKEDAQRMAGMAAGPATRTWLPTSASTGPTSPRAPARPAATPVPVEQANQFFDMLRAQSVVLGAGPRIIDMTSDTTTVPKILTATTTGWFNEAAQLSSTELTFDVVTLTARKLAAYCEVSNEALADSTPSIRDMVAHDFTRAMALGLDLAFLQGSGTPPAPRGMRNFTSVTETHAGADGEFPRLNMFHDQLARVEAAGADLASLVWFMHPRTWSDIQHLLDDNGSFYLSPDVTVAARRALWGVPVRTSSQISVTETQGGSGAACSYALLADMSQVAIGRRMDMTLQYSTDFKFDYDQTAVRATSRWDIQPINVAAVDVLDGLLTS